MSDNKEAPEQAWKRSLAAEFATWLENEGAGRNLYDECLKVINKYAPAITVMTEEDQAPTLEKEIDAMREIVEALQPLDAQARKRVIAAVMAIFGISEL